MTTNTATNAPAVSTFGSAIQASDFSQSMIDPLRDRWTHAKMQAVVEALDGNPVTIVLEKSTGFTMSNVRLVDTRPGGYSQPRVIVEDAYRDADGSVRSQRTAYLIQNIGIIIEMKDGHYGGVRFTAPDRYRKAQTRAWEIAHPLVEATGRRYGAYKMTPVSLTEVDVTYEPQNGPEAGTYWYGRVNLETGEVSGLR